MKTVELSHFYSGLPADQRGIFKATTLSFGGGKDRRGARSRGKGLCCSSILDESTTVHPESATLQPLHTTSTTSRPTPSARTGINTNDDVATPLQEAASVPGIYLTLTPPAMSRAVTGVLAVTLIPPGARKMSQTRYRQEPFFRTECAAARLDYAPVGGGQCL